MKDTAEPAQDRQEHRRGGFFLDAFIHHRIGREPKRTSEQDQITKIKIEPKENTQIGLSHNPANADQSEREARHLPTTNFLQPGHPGNQND